MFYLGFPDSSVGEESACHFKKECKFQSRTALAYSFPEGGKRLVLSSDAGGNCLTHTFTSQRFPMATCVQRGGQVANEPTENLDSQFTPFALRGALASPPRWRCC